MLLMVGGISWEGPARGVPIEGVWGGHHGVSSVHNRRGDVSILSLIHISLMPTNCLSPQNHVLPRYVLISLVGQDYEHFIHTTKGIFTIF